MFTLSSLAKYIEDASKEWQTTLASQHGRMSVDKDSNISSLDGFRDYLATLNQQHRKKRVNSSLGNPSEKFALFQDFAEGFSGIVDALATVVPYGLGSVAWGACSLVVAVSAVLNPADRSGLIYRRPGRGSTKVLLTSFRS